MAPVGPVAWPKAEWAALPTVSVGLEGQEGARWRRLRAEKRPLPVLTQSSIQHSEAWEVQVVGHEGPGVTATTHGPVNSLVYRPWSEVREGVGS